MQKMRSGHLFTGYTVFPSSPGFVFTPYWQRAIQTGWQDGFPNPPQGKTIQTNVLKQPEPSRPHPKNDHRIILRFFIRKQNIFWIKSIVYIRFFCCFSDYLHRYSIISQKTGIFAIFEREKIGFWKSVFVRFSRQYEWNIIEENKKAPPGHRNPNPGYKKYMLLSQIKSRRDDRTQPGVQEIYAPVTNQVP